MAKSQSYPFNSMQSELDDVLGAAQPHIRKQVISAVAEKVVNHRVDLLVKAWKFALGLRRELDEIKPDIEQYDRQENPVSGYSKTLMKSKKDKEKQLNDLNTAVDVATQLGKTPKQITEGWTALEKLVKSYQQVATYPQHMADLVI